MAGRGWGALRSRAEGASRKLGGKKLLGVEVRSEADLIPVIARGLPLESLAALVRDGLSPQEVDRLIIPRRTLSHRRARKEPLNQVESERALRVALITALAEDTFDDKAKADAWLRRPTRALDGRRPIDLLDSEVGGRLVEDLLYRIAHGIAA
jgi:putative toxin-antitoxin system antitoxin component (TIGR02293 family)